MAYQATTIVTVLTMLAHSVWGCCWHHAHDGQHADACAVAHSEEQHASHHSADASYAAHRGCGHPHHGAVQPSVETDLAGSHDPQDPEGPHRIPCHESRCTYMTSSPVTIAGLWAAMAAVWPVMPELPTQVTAQAFDSAADEARPPLSAQEMRALTQTWLL